MSNSSKVVHPFFSQQKPKKQKASPPTTPLPTTTIVHAPPPSITRPPPSPVIRKSQRLSVPVVTNTVSKKTTLKHVPAVASCSTPYYAPIIKPKFYSDTLECQAKKQYEDLFNFYGRIPNSDYKPDHEFSRLDRQVFGNGHIKQNEINEQVDDQRHVLITRKEEDAIDVESLKKDYFKNQNRQRSAQSSRVKKPKSHINITNREELHAFLNRTFPNWHSFSSCIVLLQLIDNKSNEKKTHQQRQWVDAYRPRSVNGLLGERYNPVCLKDWLHQMKISPMTAPSKSKEGTKGGIKKKKRKLLDGLGLLSLDSEDGLGSYSLETNDDDDDFMPVKKTAKQLKHESIKSNIIMLTGDHGVGKTTMVYTVAEQLGYEVFEINPGSRRSGKDIMSMVGEMTKSHHVTFGLQQYQVQKKEEAEASLKKPKKRRLNPCLSSTPKQANQTDGGGGSGGGDGLLKHFLRKKAIESPVLKRVPSPEPKQSLILLEEVDLLFEDDKAFWTSINELSQKSKRPIVMTCNDPDQVPFENLYLQTILELKPATDTELLPYLWLLCYSEGYVVDPADLICLMAFLGRDIRQLIQTLEFFVKNEEPVFESYLGIHLNESLVDMKLKCVPSRVAVDTFRLARCYENIGDSRMMNEDEDLDSLDQIEKALEDNAMVDSWLGSKKNGNMIYETNKDEINGFTSLWLEDDEDGASNKMLAEIESSISIMHSENIKSSVWSNIIWDESSHWDEACDAKSNNFVDYIDAINKLLDAAMMYQPNEGMIIMDYVSYIRQMISVDSKTKSSKTRSKRKRLYLPLNEADVNTLTCNRPLIDETEFWIGRLCGLKKDSRNA